VLKSTHIPYAIPGGAEESHEGNMTYDDSVYHVTRHKRRGSSPEGENMAAEILEYLKVEYARQVSIESFRVDFVLVGLNLIVEVDDPSHGQFFNQRDDREQDKATGAIGFSTVRIPVKDLDENYSMVVTRLRKEIQGARKRHGVKRSLKAAPPIEIEKRPPRFKKDFSKQQPKERVVPRGRPGAPPHICVALNCGARAWADNRYCPRCTMRIRRHGDPTVTLKRGPKKAN